MVAGEVVRMVCSNEACSYNQYVPLNTFEQFEEYVLMALKKAPRARGWTPEQCRLNLWTKKGYELVYRACGCNCGKGFVRRDMQYLEPFILLGDGTPPQPKSKMVSSYSDSMRAEMTLPAPKPGAPTAAVVAASTSAATYGSAVLGGSAMPPAVDDDSSDEEGICPLCMEEMDTTDQTFLPCPCGYQMCLYCFNHVKENLNGQCPACRSPYDTNNYRFKAEPSERKYREKKDPAVKEAELAEQAQAVARQQAQARAELIARAQLAQAAARNPNDPVPKPQAQAQAALLEAQQQQQETQPMGPSSAGSWAAITSNSDFSSHGQHPTLPARRPSQDAWGSNAGGDDVDDWEQLASGEETASVPGLDDAKSAAEVAALLRQVGELQRKVQETREQVRLEREAREGLQQQSFTLQAQQTAFDQELMTMAKKWQYKPQNSNGSMPMAQSQSHDVAHSMPPAPAIPEWPSAAPVSTPATGGGLWGSTGIAGGYSAFGGIAQPPVQAAVNQELPGLSSLFGNGMAGGSNGWGNVGTTQPTGSAWSTHNGLGSSIW